MYHSNTSVKRVLRTQELKMTDLVGLEYKGLRNAEATGLEAERPN